MAAIQHTDFFDFPAFKAALQDLKKDSDDFGKSFTGVLKIVTDQQKGLTGELKQFSTELKGMNVARSGAKEQLGGYEKEITSTIVKLNELKAVEQGMASIRNLSKASLKELKAEYKGLKAQYDALRPSQGDFAERVAEITGRINQLIPAIQEQRKNLKAATQVNTVIVGSYNQMSQELIDLKNQLKGMPGAFDPLTGKLNESNKQAVELSNRIQQLDKVLKAADAGMGVYSRNVGNYSSATQGLRLSIAQIAREAPTLSQSFQLFALAISNQIGPLQDSVQRYNAEVKELRAQGKPTQGVFKALTSSLLSSQVVLSVLVTLFTVFSGKIADFFSRIFSGSKAFDLLKEKIMAYNEAIKEGNREAGSQISQLKILYSAATDVNNSMEVRLQAVNALQRQFPEYFKNIKDEVILNGGAKSSYEALTAAIIQNSRAKAIKGKLDQIESDRLDAEIQKQKIQNAGQAELNRVQRVSGKNFLGDKVLSDESIQQRLAYDRRVIMERINKALMEQDKILANITSKEQFLKGFVKPENLVRAAGGDPIKDEKDIKKAEKDAESAARKALERLKQNIAQAQELAKQARDIDVANQEIFRAQGLIDEEEFQRRKLAIYQTYTDNVIELENRLGKNKDEAKIKGFEKELKDEEVALEKSIKKRIDDFRTFQQESVKSALASSDQRRKEEEDRGRVHADRINQIQEEIAQKKEAEENRRFNLAKARRDATFIDEIRHLENIKTIRERYGQDTADVELEIKSRTTERLKELDKAAVDFAIEFANASFQVIQDGIDAEFENSIKKLEELRDRELSLAGNNAAAREKIEKDYNRRIAKEKEKQARSEKQMALFNVAINTATAIIKTFAFWGYPAGIPFAALQLAQGALQAGIIAARPIPQYFKGTKNAKKGLSWVGEQGFELVERDGRMYVTPNKATLAMMKGGEKVYTHTESVRILQEGNKAAHARLHYDTADKYDRYAKVLSEGKRQQEIETMAAALGEGQLTEQAIERAVTRALEKQPRDVTIWDEQGIRRREERVNELNTILNNKNRF